MGADAGQREKLLKTEGEEGASSTIVAMRACIYLIYLFIFTQTYRERSIVVGKYTMFTSQWQSSRHVALHMYKLDANTRGTSIRCAEISSSILSFRRRLQT